MDQTTNMSGGHCCRGKGISLVIAMFLLSLAIAGGTIYVAETFYKVKALSNTIAVTGTAEKVVKSDTVKWSCNFSRLVDPAKLKDGSSQMKTDLNLILNTFKQRDIKDSEITIQTMTISQVCDSQNNVIYDPNGTQNCAGGHLSGYSLSLSILIQSSDVDKVTKLSQEAASYFIDQGLIFSSQPIEYYYSKFNDLKMDLIAQATTNAQDRAKQIAGATGAQLGFLQSANVGVFQVTAVNSTEVSDSGFYDTSALDKKITAVVKASFNLTK